MQFKTNIFIEYEVTKLGHTDHILRFWDFPPLFWNSLEKILKLHKRQINFGLATQIVQTSIREHKEYTNFTSKFGNRNIKTISIYKMY